MLYTRLTGYWMACMEVDYQRTGNEFLVIRQTPSPEAPFQINSEKGIEIMDGDSLDALEIQELACNFNPDIVYSAGWEDKRFLKTALYFRKRNIPVITGMDNQWKGNLKQKVAGYLSPFLVKKYFSYIWIPGSPQHIFAKKLGFASQNILTGLYCADGRIFEQIKQTYYQKQITFIGRLVEHKGLKVLFNVLKLMIEKNELNFDVHIIGNGPLAALIPQHPNIKHSSFVDPVDLPQLLENAGFLILPSLYEAWGVVVHEAALAGLPIISTYQTGAISEFVIQGYNGYVYDATNKKELMDILLRIGNLPDDKYMEMSQNSKHLAGRISLNSWSATINSILNQ